MTLIFNLLLPFLICVVLLVGYMFYRKSDNKFNTVVRTLGVLVVTVVLYLNVQPSYLPKGDTPSMSRVPIETTEAVIQDRLLKPKTEEERQERVDELLTVTQEVKDILKDKN